MKSAAGGGSKFVLFNAEYYIDIGGPLRIELPSDATGVRLGEGSTKAAEVDGTLVTVNLAFVALSERMIGWFGLAEEPSVWVGLLLSMALLALVMRKG